MLTKKIAAALTALAVVVVAWKASRPRPPQPDRGTWQPAADMTSTP